MAFHVYDLSLSLITVLRDVRSALSRRSPSLADQLERAANSVALNLSEGNRRVGKDRIHHFRIAAGSAAEVRAALQVSIAWGHIAQADAGAALAALEAGLDLGGAAEGDAEEVRAVAPGAAVALGDTSGGPARDVRPSRPPSPSRKDPIAGPLARREAHSPRVPLPRWGRGITLGSAGLIARISRGDQS